MEKKENKGNKGKELLLLVGVILLILVFPRFLSFISFRVCECSAAMKVIYDNVDYEGIQTTLISVAFTTLGFGITLRNILIGRDRDRYFGFSIKSIIRYSTKAYCKACWYMIVCIPFYNIVLYVLGYRRQLIFFTLLTVICMIIYFFTVLQRIRKDVNNETIAYIMIDNILNSDSVYSSDYREELFQKLFCDINQYPEVNLVFDKVLENFYWFISNDQFSTIRILKTWRMTVLQLTIRRNYEDMSRESIIKAIQVFSLYSFDYYQYLINAKKGSSKSIVSVMTEQLELFINNTGINVGKLAKSGIYWECISSQLVGSVKRKSQYKDNAYLLFFNYILGMLCAGACYLSMEEYEELADRISKICVKKAVLLSGSVIDAVSLIVLYYLEKSGSFDTKELKQSFYLSAFKYCNRIIKNTTEYDFDLIHRFLYKEFSVNNTSVKLEDAFDLSESEFRRGFGIFLNILEN